MSEKHCGFVINKGNATATDVCRLIKDVQDKVKEQFGVTLEPEVSSLEISKIQTYRLVHRFVNNYTDYAECGFECVDKWYSYFENDVLGDRR